MFSIHDEAELRASADSNSMDEEDDGYDEDDECQEGEDEEGAQSAGFPPPSDGDKKTRNVAALVGGNLVVKRQSLLPRVLSVSDGGASSRRPFKPPSHSGYKDTNEELTRRLWARKKFVPWGSSRPALASISSIANMPNFVESDPSDLKQDLPPVIEPLILWQPEEFGENKFPITRIEVDPLLARYLRPHQREGVQFMFECVSGLSNAEGIAGCILADDMGLGKTLQSITLLYTLLRQGFDGKPIVRRAIIVTPTSLVSNWEFEFNKWVGGRVQLLSLCESTRVDVLSGINNFLMPHSSIQVLIVSYETFRMHSSKFERSGSCDLLICDEAHRLKNDQTLTNKALATLPCKRRILLSGTPMQNDLEEFFTMINFTNSGILGDVSYFRHYYEAPIICGREPMATEEEKKLGVERSGELSAKVNQFILRRTNALLSNHLPPKIVEVVCCKLTPLQLELYNHLIQSKNVKRVLSENIKQSKILAYITALKKLCNHPKLIYDTIKSGSSGTSSFEDCLRFFPSELFSGRSALWNGGGGFWVELSGKMHVLSRLLAHLRQKTDDRIVLVSNYTQTLDLFAQLCRERRYPYLRLDGTTSIGKRQKLVNRFNDSLKDEFVFLLSSKAGGCGLNLIGGNRLVLFDPDWNPANDKQAAARVWRDGQKKRVYIYRFLSTGTIEEKVYQRQISKEGLQKVIQHEQADRQAPHGNFFSTEDLRDLFTFCENARSQIHETMNCTRCKLVNDRTEDITFYINENNGEDQIDAVENQMANDIGGFAEISGCLQKLKSSEKQVGTPLEEDLGSWGHHFDPTTVPDSILQASAGDEVSFVFTNQVDGKLHPVESIAKSTTQHQSEDCLLKENKLVYSSSLISKRPPALNDVSNRNHPDVLCKPVLEGTTKSLGTFSSGKHAQGKHDASPRNLSCLRRLPISSKVKDDDFL